MKSHFVFFIQIITAFFASFLVPMGFGKHDDAKGNEFSNSKSLVGKKAIVTERVTADAGQVRLFSTNWAARISKKCSLTSLEPGTEVTVKKSVGNVLYIY